MVSTKHSDVVPVLQLTTDVAMKDVKRQVKYNKALEKLVGGPE